MSKSMPLSNVKLCFKWKKHTLFGISQISRISFNKVSNFTLFQVFVTLAIMHFAAKMFTG